MTRFNNLLKVIFWLTTIVAATDCCYSQILPRLNQNLVLIVQQKSDEIDGKMIAASATTATTTTTTTLLNLSAEVSSVLKQQEKLHQPQQQQQQQQQQQNSDDTYFFQIEIDKYLQHIKDFINSIAINPNKTKTGNIAHRNSHINNNNNNDHNSINNNNFMKSSTMTIYNNNKNNNNNNNNNYNHNHNTIELPAHINTTTFLKTHAILPLNTMVTSATTNVTATVIATATVTPTVNANNNHKDNDDDMKYNFLELYTFMSDTLSTSCSGEYASQYCLNHGQCFVHLVGLFYCKCAEGYVGERCESKYIYAMSGGYRSSGSSSSSSSSGSVSSNIIRTVDEKKPKILSARIIMPFRALIFLTILYLSLSLLWSYKSGQCVTTHHNVATQSTRHLIY